MWSVCVKAEVSTKTVESVIVVPVFPCVVNLAIMNQYIMGIHLLTILAYSPSYRPDPDPVLSCTSLWKGIIAGPLAWNYKVSE